MKSVSFSTLGCKVNQYETEAMTKLFANAGYEIKDFGEKCDIYVINTCTVTSMGDRKSRQMIHRAAKQNPDALIAVVGCYSQVSPDEVQKIPGVGLVLGTKERSHIVELCEKQLMENKQSVLVTDIMKQREYEDMWVSSYSSKTRAFVKIEDGCTEFCTYCIIPYARGPVRSRDLENIVREVKALSENGFSEIVLTGIHLASYGKDLKEYTLLDVIKEVSKIDGIKRIRLGSIEPRILTEEFISEISKIDKMCNHFHIALQSGCDETLKRMNRKYTTLEYRESVDLIRKYFDNPAIATDIMVGFPGETKEEFESSLKFATELRLADAHVFAYSNRKGTKADKMENQVEKTLKEARSKEMIAALKQTQKEYLEGYIGKTAEVLFEQEVKAGVYEGHMTNYMKVHMKSDEDISGKFVNVNIVSVKGDCLIAE